MTELDLARAIAIGDAPSPSPIGDSVLISLRISGTGISTRPALGEKVFRDPLIWLSPETLARVSGLSVILDHPPNATLDNQEFAARSLGAIVYPYISDRTGIESADGPDLWGVARVFLDAGSIAEIAGNSTSPAVAFSKDAGNQVIVLDDGTNCLVEGTPDLIDHLAIVTAGDGAGVWDKGGPDRGIRIDIERNTKMDTETKTEDAARKDAEFPGEKLDKLLTTLDSVTKMCDGISRRMDAFEAANRSPKAADPDEQQSHDLDGAPGTPRRVAADADAERKESGEKAEIQARADSVAMAHGERAPRAMMGETVADYRKRLARGFQRHSKDFAKIDLQQVTGEVFDAIETKIYADAMVASAAPDVAPGGVLREITRVDPASGQRITSFYSHNNETTFISQMKRPGRRLVGINTPNAIRS